MLSRLSFIMDKNYTGARIATAGEGIFQEVPVTQLGDHAYSGFHQGAGEVTATEMLAYDFEKYSLVIIDEIESSLHPKTQRRLIRDLATIARKKEIQFIISTHSPYILEEIVPEGRLLILDSNIGKSTVSGISSEFAITIIDDEQHPECDVYVEDCVAKILVLETLIHSDKSIAKRVLITPFGKASVGSSLGTMLSENRFHRPTVIFLDGHQRETLGVKILPGGDAPEQVIFNALKKHNWPDVYSRIGRSFSETADILESAMLHNNHHIWLDISSDKLFTSRKALWHAMCTAWLNNCASDDDINSIINPIKDVLDQR